MGKVSQRLLHFSLSDTKGKVIAHRHNGIQISNSSPTNGALVALFDIKEHQIILQKCLFCMYVCLLSDTPPPGYISEDNENADNQGMGMCSCL